MGKIGDIAIVGALGVGGLVLYLNKDAILAFFKNLNPVAAVADAGAKAGQSAIEQTTANPWNPDALGNLLAPFWGALSTQQGLAIGNAAVQADIAKQAAAGNTADLNARILNLEYQISQGYGNAAEETALITQLKNTVDTLTKNKAAPSPAAPTPTGQSTAIGYTGPTVNINPFSGGPAVNVPASPLNLPAANTPAPSTSAPANYYMNGPKRGQLVT
jgi:hypothetical protein